MKLSITHTTQYSYDRPVTYALQKLRLRPLNDTMQTVHQWSIDVSGGKIETAYRDHHGNAVDLVSTDNQASAIAITASGTIETNDTAGVLGMVHGCAPLWYFCQQTDLTAPGPLIDALAGGISRVADPLDSLHSLSQSILSATPYTQGETYVDTPAEQALAGGLGVCQDHAQIFISAARSVGIPARYVSGYLMMNDRVDQTASHAWAEAYLDTLGWVGFDVSNGISPDQRYVRLAIGRDARDAAPVSGLRMGPAEESMIVSLQVQQ